MRRSVLFAMLVGAACTTTGPDERIILGVIVLGAPQYQPLTAPDSVQVGVPFLVTIKTGGGGCIGRTAPTRIEAPSPLVRVLTPFDIEGLHGSCPADVRPLSRQVELRFDQAGLATVRVVGLRPEAFSRRGLIWSRQDTISVEKAIVVR
jgi:hypothetical protein